jgi:DNA-binding SARP family transcriptional activator
MFLRLLGAPQVELEAGPLGLPPQKPVYLLIRLALEGDWVSREALSALFYPDQPEPEARHRLRLLVARVHALSWARGFEAETRRLRWRVPNDVLAVREALGRADWATVVALHARPLLEGFPVGDAPGFEAWLEAERAALVNAWREAALRRSGEFGARGEHREAAALLRGLLEREGLAEDVLAAYLEQSYLAGSVTRPCGPTIASRRSSRRNSASSRWSRP